MESLKFEDLTQVIGYFSTKLGKYQRVLKIDEEHLTIEMQSFSVHDANFLTKKGYCFTIFANLTGVEKKGWIKVLISKN